MLTVDPMLTIKHTSDDTGSKGACRVQTSTSVVHTYKFRNEQRKTDADWCNECSYVPS